MRYKYKMDDVDCHFCDKKGSLSCIHGLCPYIMGSLSELFADAKFREAVKNAENCKMSRKNTLKYLKEQAKERGYDLFAEDAAFRRDYMPDCETCNYSSPGFLCCSEKDGTCLKDWIRSICHAGS